jgi:hypothetical protein
MVGWSLFHPITVSLKSVLEIGVEAAGIAERVNDSLAPALRRPDRLRQGGRPLLT